MIRSINSNLKGMKETLRFESEYILLLGKNGSGKSTVVHAIELALTGAAADMAGKDVKLKSRLRHLLPAHYEEDSKLFACAVMGNGYQYDYGGWRFAPYRHVVKECMDAMTGSGDAFYRFVLEHTLDEMEIELDYPLWSQMVTQHKSHRHALLHMETNLRKSLTKHRATAKELGIALKYHRTEEIMADKVQTELAVEDTKALLKEVQERMRSFGRKVADALENQMVRWVPDNGRAPKIIDMPDGTVSVCFDDDFVPSGAETVILAVALAASLFDPEECLFIYPDKAYDPVTLAGMMRVARTLPSCAGVFIQSTIMPEGYYAPDFGWDIVDIDRPCAR